MARDVADPGSSMSSSSVGARAADGVFEGLREDIVAGRLEVGERLPSEAALAEHYGVSRPSVREAIRSLQALGLTRTRTGSGTYVASDRPALSLGYGGFSARDLSEARPHIEVPAAGLAAERRTDQQRADLVDLCDRMDATTDPAEWVELDSRFHVLVAEASGNAVFARAVGDIRDALSHQSGVVNLIAHRREPSSREHRAIAEAIGIGSAIEAREAMRAHLGAVERVVSPLTPSEPGSRD